MPGIELATACEQRLELGKRPSLPKEFVNRFAGARQMLLHKAEGERTARIKLVLARYGNVKRSVFDILWKRFIDSLAAPMDGARSSADVSLAIHSDIFSTADPFVGSE